MEAIFRRRSVKLLGLPQDVVPLCAVALGYPEKEPEPADTFLPERVHAEKWRE